MQLHRDRDRFEQAGVELVAIGNRLVRQAAQFLETQRLGGLRLLVDPGRRVYQAAGARAGSFANRWSPGVVAAGAKITLASGGQTRQSRVIGDAAQLGGVLVIAPDDTVVFSHMPKSPADLVPREELLAAARKASGRRWLASGA